MSAPVRVFDVSRDGEGWSWTVYVERWEVFKLISG